MLSVPGVSEIRFVTSRMPVSDFACRAITPLAMIAVALVYCLVGRMALLIAIPPGYATAYWPSAGIALARCLGRFAGGHAVERC